MLDNEAFPALRQIIAGTNDYARAAAASALWRLGGDADEARRLLESLLTSKGGKGDKGDKDGKGTDDKDKKSKRGGPYTL